MSLPEDFDMPEDYFEACLDFFTKYKYILDGPNTDILINRSLNNIDIPELHNLDVYDVDVMKEKSEFLRDFHNDVYRLNVGYEELDEEPNLQMQAPATPKKKYEVVRLAKKVERLCYTSGCETVVDIGSGLGYLDQLFYDATGLNVLGLECNLNYFASAVDRQMKYHENSLNHVVYVYHRVTKDSGEDIEQYLHDYFRHHGNLCITGLHSCGDLAVEGMSVFLKMAHAKTLVVMPCCYHKMAMQGNRFVNFPMSNALKKVFEKRNEVNFLGVPFMRLGAHPTYDELSLEELVFSLMSRAVLQLYAFTHKCTVKRNKRKAVKKCNTFDEYITQAASTGFTLIPNSPSDAPLPISEQDQKHEIINSFDLDKLRCLWLSYPEVYFKKVAIYILMQYYMQPVVENFILYDRLVYMNEVGVKNCEYKKFFNHEQSPRCLALIATKGRY